MEEKNKQKPYHFLIDALTVSRIIFGIVIAMIGFLLGRNGLNLVLWLLLAGWTTDILDGKFARLTKKPSGWVGKNDILFDSLMIVGVLIYFTLAGFLPIWFGVSSMLLLIYVNTPKIAHKTRLKVESLLAVFTFVYLIYLTHEALALGITLTWGVLSLLYDLDRALVLGKKWLEIIKDLSLNVKLKPFRTHLAWLSLLGALAIIIFTLTVLTGLSLIWRQLLWGLTSAVVLRSIYILWFEEEKSNKIDKGQ